MTATTPPGSTPGPRRRGPVWTRTGWALGSAAAIVLVAGGGAWLARRPLAEEALERWLASRGVAAEVHVRSLDTGLAVARLRLGDPKSPDFAVDEAEIRYGLKRQGIEIYAVRLDRPVLRATWRDGRLSFGRLDPLIQELLSRPERPDAPKPSIRMDGGRAYVATPYGDLAVTADAALAEGRLQRLSAIAAPVRLRGKDLTLDLGASTLNVIVQGGRVDARLDAPIRSAAAAGATLVGARLRTELQTPYPDTARRRLDGASRLRLRLDAQSLGSGDRRLGKAHLAAAYDGRLEAALAAGGPSGVLQGQGSVTLTAAEVQAGTVRGRALQVDAAAGDIALDSAARTWRLDRLSYRGGAGSVTAPQASAAGIRLSGSGALAGAGSETGGDLRIAAAGRARLPALSAQLRAAGGDVARFGSAAEEFRFAAPDVRLKLARTGVTGDLPRPMVFRSRTGGVLTLAAFDGRPVLTPSGGAFQASTSGGLPDVKLDVARLQWTGAGLEARGRVRAALSTGLVQGGRVDADGVLRVAGDVTRFSVVRCARVSAARLELGANDVEGVSAELCPGDGALFAASGGDWTFGAHARAVAAAAPVAQAALSGGRGRVMARSRRGRLSAEVRMEAGRVTDTGPATRFEPLELTGEARLADFIWRGELDAGPPAGPRIVHASLVHDGGIGVGFLALDTGTLAFSPEGLQPAQISPLARAVGPPVTGSVRFEGRFDWAALGAGSSGVLTIPALSFSSPAGPVSGLAGRIAFSSLAPLETAPGQTLEIARLDAIVPLTGLRAGFALSGDRLLVEGGEADVGGGKVRIERLELPFAPDAGVKGVLVLEGVQLHDLVEASPFGDKVELDARVSGRIPFEQAGGKVRITGGDLKAVAPGRLSISRAALTGVQADGALTTSGVAAAAADPNQTFTDFAYQAMENLAFQTLDATIASQPDSRLGVLFHIVGQHDPPRRQQIRLTLLDIIRRDFLNRPLPLPSGTGVDLTLDTTLNLDDLLTDYADYRRLHGSAPVQP